jgi:hypothetical protein
MAPLGFIEILDAKGAVTERVPVHSWPLSIGRSYSNQVILGDPYVCPLHLSISPDDQGRLIARDLASVNGLYAGTSGTRVDQLEIFSGTQFRLGRTLLRYCSIDHPLAPTALDLPMGDTRWLQPYVGAVALAMILTVLCLDGFLSSVERVKFADVVGSPLVTIVSLLGWAGLWGLASRIMVSHFHFNQHVTIACAAVLGFILLSTGSDWCEFILPSIQVSWFAGLFGSAIILACLVYGHLGFASVLRRRLRLRAALLVSLTVFGINAISDYAARSKFSTVMEYNGVLKPLDATVVPAVSMDQYFAGSEKLKTALDSLAQKARANQP